MDYLFCKLQNSRKDEFNFWQAKNTLILCKLKNAQKSNFTYYNLYYRKLKVICVEEVCPSFFHKTSRFFLQTQKDKSKFVRNLGRSWHSFFKNFGKTGKKWFFKFKRSIFPFFFFFFLIFFFKFSNHSYK